MIVIEKQGSVVTAYNPDHRASSPGKPSKRGVISEFSRKSRRRLLLLANRLSDDARCTFLTLTFHGDPTVSQSNAAFKRFTKRMKRMFPGASAIWRRENQPQRGSIHFHLLVFNLPFWPQREMQQCWTECTREDRSIVHVKLLKGRKAAVRYVAKYIAKLPEEPKITSLDVSPYQAEREKKSVGRAWGYMNKEALPLAPTTVMVIQDEDMRRYLWWALKVLTDRRCGNDENIVIAFSDEASAMVRYIQNHSQLWLELSDEFATICKPTMERRQKLQTIEHLHEFAS